MVSVEELAAGLDAATHDGFAVLAADGEIKYKTDDLPLTPEEAKGLVDIWLNSQGGRVVVGGIGYSVLKSEPEQLAARNVGGKGGLVGAVTCSGQYAVAHVRPDSPVSLGVAAMKFGDLVWKLEEC
ncbi:MAG: hypothetical protein Kow0069_10510 [Promethearchaeota archaeon]